MEETTAAHPLLSAVNDKLKGKFGEDILSAEMLYDFPVFTVKKERIVQIMKFLYQDTEMQFQFLTDLCGVHYPDNKGKELGIVYHLHNLRKNWRIRVKTFIPIQDPTIFSITSVFASANWMERETYDFFGVNFQEHPGLKRILNVDDMNYFPMRKEYPLEDATRDDKDDTMFGR